MTPVPEAAVTNAATLVVIDPGGRRTRVPLSLFPFRMGRAPDNNLVLRDSRISRHHAQIVHDGGRFILEDPGSRHGVWVNGQRVEKLLGSRARTIGPRGAPGQGDNRDKQHG